MKRSEYENRLRVIDAYSKGLETLHNYGSDGRSWYGSLVTLMFDQIPGPIKWKLSVMEDEACRVYSTLITYIVRNPRGSSAQEKMPIWIVAPDLPTKKNTEISSGAILHDVKVNDGLHLNGVMLIPTDSR